MSHNCDSSHSLEALAVSDDMHFRNAHSLKIRPVVSADVPALKSVIDGTGLFPPAMLDDMLAGYLRGNGSEEIWLAVDANGSGGEPIAVAYVAPERMTSGTWNLYLIAVHRDHQGQGVGASLVRHIEQALATQGERVLLVETSGLPDFERTRAFYRTNGYDEAARIREFYAEGEDKVVFWKALTRHRRHDSASEDVVAPTP